MGHGAESGRGHGAVAHRRAHPGRAGPVACEVLRKLDRMAASLPGAPFATCVAAVVETARGNCVIAAAGHPAPAVAGPDAPAARPARWAAARPWGWPGWRPPTSHSRSGRVLALYTDALVETRAGSLEDDVTALRDELSTALARPVGTLDDCCETVTQAFGPHREDDVTLVLARIQP